MSLLNHKAALPERLKLHVVSVGQSSGTVQLSLVGYLRLRRGVKRVTTIAIMDAPFGWPGGKKNLRKTLLTLIPAHDAYVEVFSGSAKLLFAKEPSKWEILNDINDDVLNFFRVAKHRPAELAEKLESEVVSAARFKEMRTAPGSACAGCGAEVERALRFIYLTWFSYGCKGDCFSSTRIGQMWKKKHPVRKLLHCVRELLERTAERLRAVLIERRDFAERIRRYDSRQTFFYCDPPYMHFGPNGRYKPLGERHAELFDLLASAKGKFLLSLDNCREARALASQHKLRARNVKVAYSLQPGRHKKVSELLISNYELLR